MICAYYAPMVLSGTVQYDGVDVHYAAQRYLSDELHAGRLPFWTPYIFSGFPWNLPGYGWAALPSVLQSTALFGIYGLSFLTILFGASLAAFILVSCAIDFLVGFFNGIDSFKPRPGDSSKNYTDFVKKYLTQYDPVDVYNHIRCRLAHNYTIGGNVALTHLHPELHDPKAIKGRKVINFEDFFRDFQLAAEAYFRDLASDPDLQKKFEKRLSLGFADVGPL